MDKTILEKAIKNKAQKRFNEEYEKACKLITSSPILNKLKIGKLSLGTNGMGYCPATDLFVTDKSKLEKETNFIELKEALMEKYIKDETENILNQVNLLSEFVSNNA